MSPVTPKQVYKDATSIFKVCVEGTYKDLLEAAIAAERAAIHAEFTTRMQKDLEGGCNPNQLEQIAPNLAYFGIWLTGRARGKA